MHGIRSRLLLNAAVLTAFSSASTLVASPLPQEPRPIVNGAQPLDAPAEQLLTLANQTRAGKGLGLLQWDEALAAAALAHCRRMSVEGPLAHRYGGELDLTERAGKSGADFSLIEENIAVGNFPAQIHEGWMESKGHRENLLNPNIDRVGIAVVFANGLLFAVADYARGVSSLNREQVEAAIAALLRARGLAILQDTGEARSYCSNGSRGQSDAVVFLVWQNPETDQLPQHLLDRLTSGRYRKAAVGSCPPQNVEGAFTVYRVAVLLY